MMSRCRTLFTVTAVSLGLLLTACGDDGASTPDVGIDMWQPDPDAAPDVGPAADLGEPDAAADVAVPDMVLDTSTPDMAADTGTADLGADLTPDTGYSNAACIKAQPLAYTAGVATVSGSIAYTDTDDDVSFPAGSTCTGGGTPGAEDLYAVQLTAGQEYVFFSDAGTGFNQAMYLLQDCGNPLTSCVAGADNAYSGGNESFTYTPTASGTYWVGIDSAHHFGANFSYGSYTLTVAETPAHAACASARVLTIPSGGQPVSITDNTALSSDEYPTLKCGTSSVLDGPQLYYKFSLIASQAYRFILDATDFSTRWYLFQASSCGTEAAISTDCGSSGTTGFFEYTPSGNKEIVYFTPTVSGDYIIAIDSYGASYSGNFTLDITEFTPAANSTCSQAQAVALTSGQTTTITGDTTTAVDEYGTGVDCGSLDLDGPQLYYEVTLAPNQTYKITLSPSFNAYAYIFDSMSCGTATAIDADCSSGGATGDTVGPVTSGNSKSFFFTSAAGGPHTIAVDSTDPTNAGTFTLDIGEFHVATNDTCASAAPLTPGTPVTGDTTAVPDEYSTLTCGGALALDGPQVYYKAALTAGKTYQVNLTPEFDAHLYAFQAASCGTASAIDADCSSGGSAGVTSGEIDANTTGNTLLTPVTSGDYILAVDSTTSTDQGSFTLSIDEVQVAFSDDFETSCTGMTGTLDWECGPINFVAGSGCSTTVYPPPAAHSGSNMWGTKLNDCYTALGNNSGSSSSSCSNSDPTDDSILSFTATIPATATSASLAYWYWEDVNGSYDWYEIRVTDGATSSSIKAVCDPRTDPRIWRLGTANLSAYAGKTVTVAFHFLASMVVQYSGLYIDDVSILHN